MERHLARLTELICLWTPDGVLAACNDAYCAFLGVRREDVVGKRWIDLLPASERESAAEFVERFRANPQPAEGERIVVNAAGERRWLYWVTQPITDESGQLVEILSEGRDITQRKIAEEEARESERRYRRLFEDASEGMVLVDVETGQVEDCNNAFLRLAGRTRAELIGRPLPLAGPGGSATTAFVAQLAAGSAQGEPLLAQLLTKDGAARDVEVNGSGIVIGDRRMLHAFFHDVTQERLAKRYREATLVLLRLLNEEDQSRELLRQVTGLLGVWTGCEAIGVRLREGDDFPYHEAQGFPADFVRAERSLCSYDTSGRMNVGPAGDPLLDCLCGLIVSGSLDRSHPCVSARGSFWTNQATSLNGASPMTRGRCLAEGYESVAMIPLKHGDAVLGLLHLTDRAPGRFSEPLIAFLESAADQIAIALAQKAKLSSLEGGLRQIAALLEEIGVGPREERPPLPPSVRAALASLSRRETEVLRLLLRNRRPATIAKELSRSVHTVRNQLKAIFRKLNVHSQEELLARLGPNADLLAARPDPPRSRRRS